MICQLSLSYCLIPHLGRLGNVYLTAKFIEAAWKADVESKSFTKYLNPLVLNVGSSHHIWSTIRDNLHDSRRAQIKCKILTGTYILQANRATSKGRDPVPLGLLRMINSMTTELIGPVNYNPGISQKLIKLKISSCRLSQLECGSAVAQW